MCETTANVPMPLAGANQTQTAACEPRRRVAAAVEPVPALPAMSGRGGMTVAARFDLISGSRAERAAWAEWEDEGGHVAPS
jgi:hypothetical protein